VANIGESLLHVNVILGRELRFAADLDITVGNEVSYNELARLSFSVINNLNTPDLRGDIGGLWENFVIAERMGNLGT